MYMPNFNFLAECGEEICEVQDQKIKKMVKNNFFGIVRKCNEAEISKPPKRDIRIPT